MLVWANRDCNGHCYLLKYQGSESWSKGHCHSIRVKGRAQEKEPNGVMERRQICINRLITTNKIKLYVTYKWLSTYKWWSE